MANILEITKGQVGIALRVKFVDDDDDPVDISSGTSPKIVLTTPGKQDHIYSASFVVDGSDGLIQYVTTPTTLYRKGSWTIRGRITISGSDVDTEKGGLIVV